VKLFERMVEFDRKKEENQTGKKETAQKEG
jgi:hypothetical protein